MADDEAGGDSSEQSNSMSAKIRRGAGTLAQIGTVVVALTAIVTAVYTQRQGHDQQQYQQKQQQADLVTTWITSPSTTSSVTAVVENRSLEPLFNVGVYVAIQSPDTSHTQVQHIVIDYYHTFPPCTQITVSLDGIAKQAGFDLGAENYDYGVNFDDVAGTPWTRHVGISILHDTWLEYLTTPKPLYLPKQFPWPATGIQHGTPTEDHDVIVAPVQAAGSCGVED